MIHHVTRLPLDFKHGANIFVFGDRQEGSEGYLDEAWQEFRDEFKRTPNSYALGVGDYGDWLRPSMRAKLLAPLSQDDSSRSMLEKDILRTHDQIIDKMEFLKGRLIGLHEGHHNWTMLGGLSLDQRLASALKAPFLGWTASTRLVLEAKKNNDSRGGYVYTMISTHGNANGRKVASALNWMEANIVSGWDADQYIMGHGCKSAAFSPSERNLIRRFGPAGVDHRVPRCLIVGGFCKSYTDGWQSGYAERAGFAPQPIGWGIISLKLVKRKVNSLARGVSGRRTKSLDVDNRNRYFIPD